MPTAQTPYHHVVWCRSSVEWRTSRTTSRTAHSAVPTATALASLVCSGGGSGLRSGFGRGGATPEG